ncbi:MAG: urease accessory protein UreE [Kaiparowitsia implicata GSE-PSE-MK54-09C]|jgi:urease accessory protein|nr:urease accessory protein UreE [Kaiparowitsia implicata GSE-PSE-MK54-09C]
MLRLTQRCVEQGPPVTLHLALTADERTRSRHCFESEGQAVYLQLPRGTVLQDGDVLMTETGDRTVQIVAKPEPVITVTAETPLQLLRAAYHLGNRHVPLEVTPGYLRLSPDSVLRAMLEQLGVQVSEGIAPFHPETGAYRHGAAADPESHSHAKSHSHSEPHSHANPYSHAEPHSHTADHAHPR